VRSIEEKLHTANFKRVRVGIENREGMGIVGEDYVLMKFSKEEKEVLEEIIQESIAGILSEILM
jgi:peptidyl-tRNA hydrolase